MSFVHVYGNDGDSRMNAEKTSRKTVRCPTETTKDRSNGHALNLLCVDSRERSEG